MNNEDNTPCSRFQSKRNSNRLLKTKSKRKKLYNELTFVENHVDTFYIGLNDVKKRSNTKQAIVIDAHMNEAEELAKDWVHPESQLVRKNKNSSVKKFSSKIEINRTNLRIRPLSFLDEHEKNNDSSYNCPLDKNDQLNFDGERSENSSEKNGILTALFDETNSTQINDKEVTILTPNRHKIFVEDTPIEIQNLYGLSLIERRKKGLNF